MILMVSIENNLFQWQFAFGFLFKLIQKQWGKRKSAFCFSHLSLSLERKSFHFLSFLVRVWMSIHISPKMTSKKEYVIVEFLGLDEVEVVPMSWVKTLTRGKLSKLICRWPQEDSQVSAQVNEYVSPETNWKKYQCRVLGEPFGKIFTCYKINSCST